jgi:nucleoid-associated protein YgaU
MTPTSVQALLQFTGLKASLFPLNSRYRGIDTATIRSADQVIAYVRRRFIPSPDQSTPMQAHTVKQGERLDNLAAQFLGDAELYWRLCDANSAMRPEELEQPGIALRVALTQGLPGSSNA